MIFNAIYGGKSLFIRKTSIKFVLYHLIISNMKQKTLSFQMKFRISVML
ncbi:hypothetical protein Premu_2213 [Hallella multisaccharivorax DSM 17128]|uniref:Uncharacterized protein n=1 Tax=Hallella multisaccharivorax DSM 17128 TaxID=688246 RepID=F8N8C2_9BACT|nr:hypothetical protein Premu_2213 [Hallella multisaccharivorax DSM 17128]